MSHFIVAVIVDEPKEELVEKALAPYQENNMGAIRNLEKQ